MTKSKSLEAKRTFSWMSPKVEVQEAGKYGKKEKGVFAKEKIKKGEIVAVAGGYIMTLDEVKQLPLVLEYLSFQVEENLFIGIKNNKEMEDNWRFNHSCDANLGQRGQLSLVAIREIRKGEELTFDYATTLFNIKGVPAFEMKCECGLKNCRKIITDNDWKIPELQKKYKGYFQNFLQEKINNKK